MQGPYNNLHNIAVISSIWHMTISGLYDSMDSVMVLCKSIHIAPGRVLAW